jgi:hypothetical protein
MRETHPHQILKYNKTQQAGKPPSARAAAAPLSQHLRTNDTKITHAKCLNTWQAMPQWH